MISSRRRALPVLAVLALGLGACGSDPAATEEPGAESGSAGGGATTGTGESGTESASDDGGSAGSSTEVPIDAYIWVDEAFAGDGPQLSADDVADIADQVAALAPDAVVGRIQHVVATSTEDGGQIETDWAIEAEGGGELHRFALVDGEVVPAGTRPLDADPLDPTPPAPEVSVADLVASALDEHQGGVLTVELPVLTDLAVIAVAIRQEDGTDVRVTLDTATGEIIDAIDPAASPMLDTGRDDDLPAESALGLPAGAFAEHDELCPASSPDPNQRRGAIITERLSAENDEALHLVELVLLSGDAGGLPASDMRLVDAEGVVDAQPGGASSARTAFADLPESERAGYEGWSVPISRTWLAAIEARPGEVTMFAVPDGADRPMTSFCIVRADRSYDRVTVDGVTGEVLAATQVAEPAEF
ncbi:MAG: hypothetical protein ACTHXO_06605 [Actinomycetaceae bacterium]